MKQPVTGLVFAGGQSRRMGTHKALLEWKGEPLWKIAADKLAETCSEVIILSGNQPYAGHYPSIPDSPNAKGPLAGLIAGMETAQHEIVLALGCDMPLIPSTFLIAMQTRLEADMQVLIPEIDGQRQFLCSLWRKSALPKLVEAGTQGEFALKNIIPKLSVQYVAADLIFGALPAGAFLNVNTPADWEILHQTPPNGH